MKEIITLAVILVCIYGIIAATLMIDFMDPTGAHPRSIIVNDTKEI